MAEITGTSGPVTKIDVLGGVPGAAGVSVTTAELNADGHLIIGKSNGVTIDVGQARGDVTPEALAARDAAVAAETEATKQAGIATTAATNAKSYEGKAAASATAASGAAASAFQATLLLPQEDGAGVAWPTTPPIRPLVSTQEIVTWGHSLVWSSADSGAVAGVLQSAMSAALPGATITNMGVGGTTSTDIAMFSGGIIPLVTLPENVIPGSTDAVTVTITPASDFRAASISVYGFPGSLMGIPGVLTQDVTNQIWSWKRTTPGDSVTVLGPVPLISSTAAHADATTLILNARNNLYANGKDMSVVLRDTDAMIRRLTPYVKRVVILADLYATTEGTDGSANNLINREKISSLNAARKKRYEGKGQITYFDLNAAFITRGMAVAGLTSTEEDAAALAADRPAPSLMSDTVHPNAVGYAALGALIAEFIDSLDWGYDYRPVVASDTFTRADGVLNGSTCDGRRGGTPHLWTEVTGRVKIVSGQMGKTEASGYTRALLDVGVSEGTISARLAALPTNESVVLIGRSSPGGNTVNVRITKTGDSTIRTEIAGVSTTVGAGPTFAAGDTAGLRIETVDGVLVASVGKNGVWSAPVAVTGVPVGTRWGVELPPYLSTRIDDLVISGPTDATLPA